MAKTRGNALLRSLDGILGIPALMVLGALKRRRSLPARIESIGLLRTACLGDTLMLAGIIPDLREHFPDARIVVFAGSDNHEIATMLAPDIEVRRIDIARPLESMRVMRRERLDVMIDYGQWPKIDALLAVCARAKCTLGFNTPGQRRHYAFDIAVPHRRELHEIENFRNVIRELDAQPHHAPVITIEAEPLPACVPPQPYVVFHLWPSGTMNWVRQWPRDYWIELTQRAIDGGRTVVFTGSRADQPRNQEVIDQVRDPDGRIHNVAGELTLRQTALALKHAVAVVSVNTGIMHLAAAVEAPLVTINGPVATSRWGAVGENVIALESDVEGCGYLYLGFEYQGQRLDCMAHISVDRAHAALEQAVALRTGSASA